jgi:hypothetical protein
VSLPLNIIQWLLETDHQVCGATAWIRDPLTPHIDDEEEDFPCGNCPASQPWVDDEPTNTNIPECLCGRPMRGPFRVEIVWKEN